MLSLSKMKKFKDLIFKIFIRFKRVNKQKCFYIYDKGTWSMNNYLFIIIFAKNNFFEN